MTVMACALEADYLVVGAGASGMAFADALIRHADVQVALVDRRHGPGGHWLDAYPFVRLHQASSFYGVASTMLGSGSIQGEGPEAGLHERAGAAEICAYYQRVLYEQLVPSGRVEFHPNSEYRACPDSVIKPARIAGSSTPATSPRRSPRPPSRRSASPTGSGRCRSTSYRGWKPHPGSS
jgi:choline dehydrogenase-like flavoprotein